MVYTTFHHPDTQANVITTEYSDWATNCPEYKVTAVQISPSNGPSDWQKAYRRAGRPVPPHRAGGSGRVTHAGPGLFRARRQIWHDGGVSAGTRQIPEETALGADL